MIPVLILTHGNLASELLQAAQTIDPNLSGRAAAMSLPWDVDSDEASRSLKTQLRELDQGEARSSPASICQCLSSSVHSRVARCPSRSSRQVSQLPARRVFG